MQLKQFLPQQFGLLFAPFMGGVLVDEGGYTWLGAAEVMLTIAMALIILIAMPKEIK